MKKVIKRIEEDIKYEIKHAECHKNSLMELELLNERSWSYQRGILISINEARELVDIVKKYYNLTEPKLKIK
jgi:hypothetical protein